VRHSTSHSKTQRSASIGRGGKFSEREIEEDRRMHRTQESATKNVLEGTIRVAIMEVRSESS
jgi:hypothetical protein